MLGVDERKSTTCIADVSSLFGGEIMSIKVEDVPVSVGNLVSNTNTDSSVAVLKAEFEAISADEACSAGKTADFLKIDSQVCGSKVEGIDVNSASVSLSVEQPSVSVRSCSVIESGILCKEEDPGVVEEVDEALVGRNLQSSFDQKECFQMDDKSFSSAISSNEVQDGSMELCEGGYGGSSTSSAAEELLGESQRSRALCSYEGFKFADHKVVSKDSIPNKITRRILKPFSCRDCPARFRASRRLKIHETAHTNVKSFSCAHCFATFRWQNALFRHMRLHNFGAFLCVYCSDEFKSEMQLEEHLSLHAHECPYLCTHCPAKFKSKGTLKRHLTIHTNVRPYSCSHCCANFKRKEHLKDHLSVHDNETRQFKSEGNLKKHLILHAYERPYSCTHCPAKFKSKGTLKRHLTVHTNARPYSCSHCCANFKRKAHLKDHLSVHDNERPYYCPRCHAEFESSADASSHHFSHSDKEPFVCKSCLARFSKEDMLISRHNNFRWYVCMWCHDRFRQKLDLDAHLINSHAGEMPVTKYSLFS